MRIWKMYTGFFLCILLLAAGCSVERTDEQKIKDLDFVIVEESQMPEGLMTLIEEKKQEAFKLVFDTEKDKYIVVGYGRQKTNGYSISVEELYITSNAVYINTNLIGPSKGEAISEVESFPYIVVKTEYLDKSVVFE
ncbi:MAG: protease complex subunit PrcB family protein [Lachnospiraceae bacterium]|jgi:hypothetical protein|nr:protease complex subunit PrcB family protein [Lachnospiraceae bacterium]